MQTTRLRLVSLKIHLDLDQLKLTLHCISGHQFRTIGAVEHVGSGLDAAHYKLWGRSRTDAHWSIYNDNSDRQLEKTLPTGLKDITYLLMERL
jgi:hypothetical protein